MERVVDSSVAMAGSVRASSTPLEHIVAELPAERDDVEYHDFVQVLGGTTYILSRDNLPDPVEGLRSTLMCEHIARGVETLLLRIRADGWEPIDSTDPNTLWLNGQVAYERRRSLLSLKTHYNLSSVRIRCARPK